MCRRPNRMHKAFIENAAHNFLQNAPLIPNVNESHFPALDRSHNALSLQL